jgi:hypothetical protein
MTFLETCKRIVVEGSHAEIQFLNPSSFVDSGGEDSHTWSSLVVETSRKFVELQTYQVTARVPLIEQLEIPGLVGIDSKENLLGILYRERQAQQEKALMKIYVEEGEKESSKSWNLLQRILNRFGYVPKFCHKNLSEQILKKMVENSEQISSKTHTGPANFAVISHKEFYILSSHPEFVKTERDSMSMAQIYSGGKIRNFTVFVDPRSQGRLIVGSTTKENEPGVYFIENAASPEKTELTSSEGPVLALRSRQRIVNLGEENHKYTCIHLSEKRYNFFSYIWQKIK